MSNYEVLVCYKKRTFFNRWEKKTINYSKWPRVTSYEGVFDYQLSTSKAKPNGTGRPMRDPWWWRKNIIRPTRIFWGVNQVFKGPQIWNLDISNGYSLNFQFTKKKKSFLIIKLSNIYIYIYMKFIDRLFLWFQLSTIFIWQIR